MNAGFIFHSSESRFHFFHSVESLEECASRNYSSETISEALYTLKSIIFDNGTENIFSITVVTI